MHEAGRFPLNPFLTIVVSFLAAAILFPSGIVRGEEGELPPHPPEPLIDRLHAGISFIVVHPFERFDQFFADQRVVEEERRSRLHAAVGVRYDRFDHSTLMSDVRLRIALPHLEERLQIFLDETFSVDDPTRETRLGDAVEESTPDVGIRYFFRKTGRWSIRGDLGGRLGSRPQGLVRLRVGRVIAVGGWDVTFSQSVIWLTRDGFGETSEVNWNRPLQDDRLFRVVNRLSWSEAEPGVAPQCALELFGVPAPRWGYRHAIVGSFPAAPHTREALHTISSTFRRLIHSSWLYLDLGAGVDFPQTHGYNPNPFVIVRVEAVFS